MKETFRLVSSLSSLLLFAAPIGCGGDGTAASADGTGSGSEGSAGESGSGEDAGEGGNTGTDGADFEWSSLDEYELRIDDTSPPPLMLEMDEAEVAELFGDVADDILLLELDSTPLLVNALNEIKSACGTDWMNDKPDPVYDCDLTPLGQSFVGFDGTWQTSAEFSAIRILTMTPANAKVEGTSIEGTQELADLLNIGGGFSQILSDSMGISRTTEFLGTAALSEALRENVIGTHPNLDASGELPVTLHDALNKMAPLSDKFGPVGNHPGVLDPAAPPYGEMFADDFTMTAVAESNLKILDGADLSVSKEFVTVVQDLVGPTFDDPAEFDFEDPEKFGITGLNPNPTVDLRFNVVEHPTFVQSCSGDDGCVDNLPGNPVGQATVWLTNPWVLEYSVASAGILTYGDRVHQQCYPTQWLCTAEVKVGQSPYPSGYTAGAVSR
jgi:hypothetical protein